jgi:hypothetical protein
VTRRPADRVDEAAEAADPVQADEGQRQERGDDDEELQDLVVDRRRQPTHAGSDRPDRKKSGLSGTRLRAARPISSTTAK